MNIIIDTHFILWILTDANKLKKDEIELIKDNENIIYCSSISLFEISLKYSIGKLKLEKFEPEDIPDLLKTNGYEIIDVSYSTFATYYKLPNEIHKDPFDRILIWEAIQKNYFLLSRDKNIEKYEKYGLKTIKS